MTAAEPAVPPPPAPPRGDPGRVYRIGILTGGTTVSRFADGSPARDAFRTALAELGYVEGKNVALERRDAEGRYDRLARMARDLLGQGVDLIVAPSNADAEAAKDATRTVPVVFVGADPVGTGLVASRDKPGGNVTGITVASHARGRRMALLKEAVPALSRAAVLVNLAYTGVPFQLRQTELSAQSMAVALHRFEVRDSKDLTDAFTQIGRLHPDGLIVLQHPMFAREARRLAEFTQRARLPTVAPHARIAEAGALLAYEPDTLYPFRRAATYVDRIFKGGAPATMAVEEGTRFRLVVNLRTARALNLRLPKALVGRADHVIR
jgi:ABC-type uncharacterized transport system substrate-binding protein